MIVTGKHLPRRTFLQGLRAAIALPMLDAMTPAFGAVTGTSAKTPARLAFAYVPNGIIMQDWTPNTVGENYEFTRILKPLEAHRKEMSVLTGLAQHNGNALGDGGGDHARASASYLTGVHPKKTLGADLRNGISVDQVAAQALGSQTLFPSIELSCEDTRMVGNCDTGYSCAYTNSISWSSPTTPMPPETNPRSVFERLFGSLGNSLDPQKQARLTDDRKSILDFAQEHTRQLVKSLGTGDRRKMDEYLYSIRDIERRITRAERENREFLPTMEKPSGIPGKYSDHIKLMYDLQVMAFRADLTRVATLVYVREGSAQSFPETGIPDGHHPLTHHRDNPEWIEKVTQINTFHVQLLSYFIEKLKSTPEGDGSLLDHSMVIYGSGISDGNQHLHHNLPVLLFGRGNGTLRPGRHIRYQEFTPMNNLFLSLLDRMGMPVEDLGDSTGKLDPLTEV
jgi:hypothetical protein